MTTEVSEAPKIETKPIEPAPKTRNDRFNEAWARIEALPPHMRGSLLNQMHGYCQNSYSGEYISALEALLPGVESACKSVFAGTLGDLIKAMEREG